jgi:hypothetical protein
MAEASSVYSIVWSVKNSSNTIGGASVSTVLPPYAEFVSGGSGIAYEASTRTVKWTIGDVKPGIGYTQGALSNNFTVKVTPSVSQVGNPLALTGSALVSGTDRFTSSPLQANAAAPMTLDTVAPKQ